MSELGGVLVEHAMRLAKDGQSFDSLLNQIVTMADDSLPSPIWNTIKEVDRRSDVGAFNEWISRKLTEDAPDHLSGLWFGLYEVGGGDRHPRTEEAVLEVSGGPGFFDDPDWLDKQSWYPGGYAPTAGLRSLLPIGESGGEAVSEVVSYAIVFTYAVGLVLTALEEADLGQIILGRPKLGVAAGFHDGDIARLGVLTSSGFNRSGVQWI